MRIYSVLARKGELSCSNKRLAFSRWFCSLWFIVFVFGVTAVAVRLTILMGHCHSASLQSFFLSVRKCLNK